MNPGSEKQNETTEQPKPAEQPKKSPIVDQLFDVAEAWASYGLKVAGLALQTSARTLENLSKALGELATKLKKNEGETEQAHGPA